MSKQIKCPTCGNWNDAFFKECPNCKTSLVTAAPDSQKDEKNTYKEFVGKLKGQSDWIDRFFAKAKNGNIFIKGLAYFLQFLWMVYFSLLLFVAWLVFIVAG